MGFGHKMSVCPTAAEVKKKGEGLPKMKNLIAAAEYFAAHPTEDVWYDPLDGIEDVEVKDESGGEI